MRIKQGQQNWNIWKWKNFVLFEVLLSSDLHNLFDIMFNNIVYFRQRCLSFRLEPFLQSF